ncbi:hypothetical protein ABZP36_002000 [Zizania latifolia]
MERRGIPAASFVEDVATCLPLPFLPAPPASFLGPRAAAAGAATATVESTPKRCRCVHVLGHGSCGTGGGDVAAQPPSPAPFCITFSGIEVARSQLQIDEVMQSPGMATSALLRALRRISSEAALQSVHSEGCGIDK